MKAAKYLGAVLLSALGLYLFVVNFSSVASSFECVGNTSSPQGSRPATIYIKLEKYRWWVSLWSESIGSLHVEVPDASIEYFGPIVKVGDQFQIIDGHRQLKGHFSALSNMLSLGTASGIFDGSCTRKQ